MSNLNEKRVKALLKGNAIVDKAIELIKAEKRDMACTIRAFHNTAKQMLEVKKLLSSPKFKNELKKAEIKGMTMKKLVPLAVGMEYPTFARELQVAKVTITQLNAFIKAVKEDESISVSKQGLLSFVKGKKKEKTDTIIITDEGGEEETKEGGQGDREQVFNYGGVKVDFVKKGNTKVIDFNGASPQDFDKAMKQFQMDIKLHNASVEKVK